MGVLFTNNMLEYNILDSILNNNSIFRRYTAGAEDNMLENLSIKIDSETKKQLKSRADKSGKSLSEYSAELLKAQLENDVRSDLLIKNISDEIFQIKGMLGIMQGYNNSVFSLLLGRTDPHIKTENELNIAKEDRAKAYEMLNKILTSASKSVINGENVWGEIEE